LPLFGNDHAFDFLIRNIGDVDIKQHARRQTFFQNQVCDAGGETGGDVVARHVVVKCSQRNGNGWKTEHSSFCRCRHSSTIKDRIAHILPAINA